MRRVLLPVTLLFWAGVVFGVAYVAAPAVFTAASVTRQVGIDATRHSFTLLNRAEIVLAGLSLLLLLRSAAGRIAISATVLACAIVALETLWMLPTLDRRADIVMRGAEPPPSPVHTLYVVGDSVKVLALLAGGVAAVRRLRKVPSEEGA